MSEYIVNETVYPLATKQEVVGELVRCKDCKYADKYHHCERMLMWTTAEDYCSRGERQDE